MTGGRGVPSGALVPLVYFMSSDTQSDSARGVPTDAARTGAPDAIATGPRTEGPPCSNRTTGGVLLTAISLNGLMT